MVLARSRFRISATRVIVTMPPPWNKIAFPFDAGRNANPISPATHVSCFLTFYLESWGFRR
jgi:hypothetical protein